jgi:D-alanyl-D-alanine carboxypeptidase/D-alanyl-D-alanine-endopeptidase (penicillin-binding protein 4)
MAEISALSFNDNCIDVTLAADGTPGGTARVEAIAPRTDYYRIESGVGIVEAGTSAGNPDFRRDEQARVITAVGKLAAGENRTRWTAVDDPARYAAEVLRTVLVAEGIAVDGQARSRHRAPGATEPTPPADTVLLRHVSEPVSSQMVVVLANSQNLYAETFGRHAALAVGKPPTFRGATETIAEYLEGEGLMRDGFALFDTSGLSSLNRIPPRATADLLLRVEGWGFNGALFRDSLDQAGIRGTMKGRLPELSGRLRGKTGKLGDTDAFAGYLTTVDGRQVVVVVMIDLAAGDSQRAVDEILKATDAALAP